MSRYENKKVNVFFKNNLNTSNSQIGSDECEAKNQAARRNSPYRLVRQNKRLARGRGRDIAYLRWRKSLNLPEESVDFSDRDVFDVADYLIDTYCQRNEPIHLVVARQRQAAMKELVLPAATVNKPAAKPMTSKATAVGHAA